MRDRSARAMGRADARGRAWRRADRSRGRAFRNRLERNGFSVETRDARRETRETGSTPMTRAVIGKNNPSSRRRRRSRWTDVSIAPW